MLFLGVTTIHNIQQQKKRGGKHVLKMFYFYKLEIKYEVEAILF